MASEVPVNIIERVDEYRECPWCKREEPDAGVLKFNGPVKVMKRHDRTKIYKHEKCGHSEVVAYRVWKCSYRECSKLIEVESRSFLSMPDKVFCCKGHADSESDHEEQDLRERMKRCGEW